MNLVVKFNIQGKKMKSIIFLNKKTIFLTKQELEINKLKIYDYINKKIQLAERILLCRETAVFTDAARFMQNPFPIHFCLTVQAA